MQLRYPVSRAHQTATTHQAHQTTVCRCTRCGFRPVIFVSEEQRRGIDHLPTGQVGNFARRRLQNDYDLGIAPSPPPPPPPVGKGTGLFNEPLPPPSPNPPPPPPNSPPPSPHPSPSPPPNPPGTFQAGRCHCYDTSTQDSGEWSEMEMRAKADYVDQTAVTYLARSALTRGKSNETKPAVWVPGGTPGETPAVHILKWIDSPAVAGELSHLVDGWRPNRAGMILETLDLQYYNGVKPSWWPAGDSTWVSASNNTHSPSFWASVCTSACLRDHRDEVHMVLVDLDASNCICYAWEDPEEVDTHRSHSAPSDAQLLRFLEGATRDLVARVSLYAVAEKLPSGHYWGSMQSTVYHSQILNTEYVQTAALSPAKRVTVDTLDLCFEECGAAVGVALNTISWIPSTLTCSCYEEDFSLASHGTDWKPRTAEITEYYRARFCRNVRATSDRSLVYSKTDGRTCPGVPVRHPSRPTLPALPHALPVLNRWFLATRSVSTRSCTRCPRLRRIRARCPSTCGAPTSATLTSSVPSATCTPPPLASTTSPIESPHRPLLRHRLPSPHPHVLHSLPFHPRPLHRKRPAGGCGPRGQSRLQGTTPPSTPT